MEALSGAASVIAVIQVAGSIAQICGGYISKVKNANQDICHLQQEVSRLGEVLKTLYELLRGRDGGKLITSDALFHDVANCSSTLANLKKKIDPETTQNPMRKWGLRALKWPLQHAEVEKVISDIERYKSLFSLALQVDQTRTTNLIDRKLDLDRLKIAEGAAFDSYENEHDQCLPGTRIDLLRQVEEWAESSHGKCIFWLNGMAGTGKSTVSQTVAARLKRKSLLGASFFFKRSEKDRAHAKRLFPTLTNQLMASIPLLAPSIQKVIQDDPYISEKALGEQFNKLILQSLQTVSLNQVITMVIVIDALDECDWEENKDDIRVILKLLPQVQTSSSVRLRFFLTSRPELPIRLGFKDIIGDHQDFDLHEVPKPAIEHDISLFLKDKFSQIRQDQKLPPDWPGERVIQILISRTIPLFISAATLCRFISDARWNTNDRLKTILADQSTYVSKMDSTYMPVLNQLLINQDGWELRQLVQEFKEIVGIIIILATPLSVNALARLLNIEVHNINTRLDLFHSVLNIPGDWDTPVRLLHLSFRDFLLDDKRKDHMFWINKEEMHQNLTIQCLQLMSHSLRKNICNLPGEGTHHKDIPGNTINLHLPLELQYSCRYWAQHLIQSKSPLKMLDNAFSFLQKHFLHWMEAMSILGLVSELFEAINCLQTIIHDDKGSQISEFLYDAKRYTLKNGQMANIWPLQLYCSGLIFAPSESIIRRKFIDELPGWISCLPKVEKSWSAEQQTLEDHSDWVNTLAFSPDGRLLVSGSVDNTIRLWDLTAGALQQTLEGHSSSVNTVAFSSDGRLLASGSWDNTVRLWDPATGALQQTLKGHSGRVNTVAFSSNGRLLASGSSDKTIKLWDPTTGALQQTLEGHSSSVNTVAFSSDDRLLASGSWDNTVRLWDPATRALQQTLKGHSSSVNTVAFSLDGRLLASGSVDNAIRLWDPTAGALQHILEGHSSPVNTVAFSSDGRLLASGSWDNTVKLWDPATGALQQTFEGHSSWVNTVAFSLDGRLLASGSSDKTIKLWDPTTGALQQTFEGHSSRVNTVAFSSDGQLLASGSRDNTIKLWDPATGTLQRTLEGHSGRINMVAFSSNGRFLASGSGDKTVKLWDPATGALQQTLTVGEVAATLGFTEDYSYLRTEFGYINIQPWKGKGIPNQPKVQVEVFIQDNRWITLNGTEKVLWLPSDYRPTCSAVAGGTVVLGHTSGRVSFFKFC